MELLRNVRTRAKLKGKMTVGVKNGFIGLIRCIEGSYRAERRNRSEVEKSANKTSGPATND